MGVLRSKSELHGLALGIIVKSGQVTEKALVEALTQVTENKGTARKIVENLIYTSDKVGIKKDGKDKILYIKK